MNIKEQLARDEGLRLKPYTDTTGHVTIGFGRNLSTVGISIAEADAMLEHDLLYATSQVLSHCEWARGLDEPRRAALINMAFNLGITGLLGFANMLAAMQEGDWKRAAAEMKNSTWAEQVGVRAERLEKQVLTGEWQ